MVTSSEDGCVLARFDGQRRETLALDGPARSVAEVEPGVVMVGVEGRQWGRHRGIRKVTWASKKVEPLVGPENVILEIIKLKDGRVFAASWWSLYESDSAETP